jgi:hypothetical protein
VGGGALVIVTPLTVEVMVTLEAALLLRSVADVAVTDTVFPDGTPIGAVNVVGAPLAVWGGVNVPQMGALPHIATQSTPAFATSLLTVAETLLVLPTVIDEGGVWVMATEIVGVTELFVLALVEQPTMLVHRQIANASDRNTRQVLRFVIKITLFLNRMY